MCKKVSSTTQKHEHYAIRKTKTRKSPGKQREHLSMSEGEAIEINDIRCDVGQLMFFTMNIGHNLGSTSRGLSNFVSNPCNTRWVVLYRVKSYLKSTKVKDFLHVELESHKTVEFDDVGFGNCTETRRSVESC